MPIKKKPAIPVDNPDGEIRPEVAEVLEKENAPEPEPVVTKSKSTAKREAVMKEATAPVALPPVIFESIDGRKLSASIGRFFVEGRRIEVPREYADEVERLLKEGHYLVTKIA